MVISQLNLIVGECPWTYTSMLHTALYAVKGEMDPHIDPRERCKKQLYWL